jgi:hypothetical protein
MNMSAVGTPLVKRMDLLTLLRPARIQAKLKFGSPGMLRQLPRKLGLAASSGVHQGKDWVFQLTRPGQNLQVGPKVSDGQRWAERGRSKGRLHDQRLIGLIMR